MPIVLASPVGAAVLGGRSFDPANIATLQVRLDFDDMSTLYQTDDTSTPVTATSQSIGYVRNKGALGGAFIQSTAGSRLSYGTFSGSQLGAIGASKFLVWNGAASAFNFLHNGSRRVIMAQLYVTTLPPVFSTLWDSANGADLAHGITTYFLTDRSITDRAARNNATFTFLNSSAASTVPLTTAFVLTERFQDQSADTNDARIRLAGTSIATADRLAAPSTSNASYALTIFRQANGAAGFVDGRIRRLWIWELPSNYPDDWIPTAEAAIVL